LGIPTVEDIATELSSLKSHGAEALRRYRRRLSKALAAEPGRDVIEIAAGLLRTQAPGRHVIAYELILHHDAALRAVRADDLQRLGETMSSWAETDTFACYVAGPVWRAGQVSDEFISAWAGSAERWWRRAALVSTVPLNVKAQGGTGDAERTLAICALLVEDRDDMVVKAMSWALRALTAHAPDAVTDLLKRHERKLAPRVLREVRSKLSTGLKAPKRHSTR
jgi:3-methyladenine DNA glycosylase AlkD